MTRRQPSELDEPYRLPAAGQLHLGTFVKTTSPQVIEILAGTGLDFAVLDAEHAPWDRAALDIAILAGRGLGLPLFVRVLDHQASSLLAVLDLGATGLLVPHVDSADQAREVVAHARFVGGDRGYSGSPRFAGYGSLGMQQAIRRGDQALVICQIEGRQAVDQAAAIAAVPGVAGLFIGRADLALSMGLDTTQHAQVEQATAQVMQAAQAAGKLIGVAVGSSAEREKFFALGARWIVQSSDQGLLRQAVSAMVSGGVSGR